MRPPDKISYLLDANLPHTVGEALTLVGMPYQHVSRVVGWAAQVGGHCIVPDDVIAQHAADHQLTILSADKGFARKWALAASAEVIIVDPTGPAALLTLLVSSRARVEKALGKMDYPSGPWRLKKSGQFKRF